MVSALPQSQEEERALLGSIIYDPDLIKQLVEILHPEDFYHPNSTWIYQAFLALYQEDIRIDHVTLGRKLQEIGAPHGIHTYAALLAEKDDAFNALHHARNVIDLARRRRAIKIHRSAASQLADLSHPTDELLNSTTQQMFDLALEGRTGEGISPLAPSTVEEALRRLERARKGEGRVGAVPLPWSAVARLVPLRAGEVTVVAGRPGAGKTAYILNIALHAAKRENIPVGIFSLEMNKVSVLYRFASILSGVGIRDIEEGKVSDEQYGIFARELTGLHGLPIYIDDYPELDELTFIAKSRAAKQRYNLGLIVLDYLQLMNRRGNIEHTVQAVESCAKTVRKTARLLNIPILEASQVSRACENLENKRPQLSDLRESGGIEQEADIVVGLYRDEYYTKEKSKFPGMAEINVLKHRNGGLGTAYLYFQSEITKFNSFTLAENYNGGARK